MDIVTHSLLGALSATAISRRRPQPQVATCGLIGGMLPDADVLIQSASDPLLVLEYHRQFTHSLFFAPLGALVAALLLGVLFLIPRFERQLPWSKVYFFTLTGYLSAILLDACTSYGTQLFWPWGEGVALGIIAVVDPLFSAVLLTALFAAFFWRSHRAAGVGVLLVGTYLFLGQVQHWRAAAAAEKLAQSRGLEPERIVIKPTMGNLLLWRALTVTEDRIWADAVRLGVFAPVKTYTGEQAELIKPGDWSSLPEGSAARRALHRFSALSDQLLVAHPDEPNMLGDARYAMLPHSTAPLWGIVINPEQPNEPVDFVTRREFTPAARQQFIAMLRGEETSAPK